MKRREEVFAPLWELSALWAPLTAEERREVLANGEVIRYEKNDIIHLDGDASANMWVLLRGKVRIYKEGIGQRQQIIRLLKPFDIFGYRACIAGEPYNASASAFESCSVFRIPRECFTQLIRSNGAFCYGVMLTMAKDLANMSNMTTSNAIRTLSQFAQEGLIDIDGRRIRIRDEKALEKISRLG